MASRTTNVPELVVATPPRGTPIDLFRGAFFTAPTIDDGNDSIEEELVTTGGSSRTAAAHAPQSCLAFAFSIL